MHTKTVIYSRMFSLGLNIFWICQQHFISHFITAVTFKIKNALLYVWGQRFSLHLWAKVYIALKQ